MRRYLRYRLVIPLFRSQHPPEYTARGVAIGVLWGVTPFLGLQTLLMVGTWQVLKHVFGKDASIVQALAWAWINNPLTMIPMYYAFYVTGLWLVGAPPAAAGYDAFVRLWETSAQASFIEGASLLARQVGVALVVGCIPYALVAGWVSYWWALRVVQARRRRIRQSGRARTALHGSEHSA